MAHARVIYDNVLYRIMPIGALQGEWPMSTMEWYAALSRDRDVSLRCPFAAAELCPRYFLSQWVLNSMEERPQNVELEKLWEKSSLYPSVPEDFPSASGGKALHYGKFCPEVAYERFERFASEMTEYFDGTEREVGFREVENGGPEWKADWLHLKPRHYTECPLYAPLLRSPAALPIRARQAAAPVETNQTAPLIVLKPTLWGMSFDLSEAWKRGRKWLSNRVGRSS